MKRLLAVGLLIALPCFAQSNGQQNADIAPPVFGADLGMQVVFGYDDTDIPIDPPLDLENDFPLVFCYEWKGDHWAYGGGLYPPSVGIWADHVHYHHDVYDGPIAVVIVRYPMLNPHF